MPRAVGNELVDLRKNANHCGATYRGGFNRGGDSHGGAENGRNMQEHYDDSTFAPA